MKTIVSMILALVMIMSMATVAMAEEPLKIGVIGPTTGAAASYGISVTNGAELAVSEINAKGGMQIQLFKGDDANDAEQSYNVYNDMWDDNVQMIVGTVTSTPCVNVAGYAYEDRMFMLTPSASTPDVTANNDNVYQLCFTDPGQGEGSAQYVKDHNLATKIAVIYNNADTYSSGIAVAFEAKAKELGLEIVKVIEFNDETTDFSVQVTDVKNAGAELVFMPIYYTPASMILQQAAAINYDPVFFGGDGMDGLLNIEGFDTSLAEGLLLMTPFSTAATDELTVNFVKNYEAAYGATPDQFAADGYDCVYALYQAALNAGITGETKTEDACEMLIEQFGTLEITGTTGAMSWNEDGAVNKVPVVVQIVDGAYVGFEG
ncbi:MAG: ABC transporter substrate-binding protein [Clostridiales bacterium]|nr:ABC transporter substrate-binding protein [Clostridiales bacterium]